MTIELTDEEARMLLGHLDYYLTLTHYDWQDDPNPEREKLFIEALQQKLLSSVGGNSVRENNNQNPNNAPSAPSRSRH